MLETVLLGLMPLAAVGPMVHGGARNGVSHEAHFIDCVSIDLVGKRMTSVALTGAVNEVASQLMDVIAEARNDPEQLLPSALTTARVFDFLYVLPRGTALPEATLDPDGEVGLDWMISKNRILSVSIGESNRISYAWHDGTDRGHAAVTFDGRKLPSHLMTLLTEMGLNATSAVRAA